MKKLFFILIISFIAISCGNESQSEAQSSSSSTTGQATIENTQNITDSLKSQSFSENFRESNNSQKSETSSFLYLIIFLSIILSLFSICLTLWLVSRDRTRNDNRMEKRKAEIAWLKHSYDKLYDEFTRLKSQNQSTYSRHITGTSTTNQTLQSRNYQQVHDHSQNSTQKSIIQEKKKIDNSKKQQTKPIIKKVLYLGANSEDCFFDFSEEKSDTSRFIAHIITGDAAAEYEIIDVERIRSLNTRHSIRQEGIIPIKDAQGIENQKPGKIHKTTDPESGQTFWIIDEPVTVKFRR